MQADPYLVQQFPPYSPNVSIGRGVYTADAHADAVAVANALLEAGLVTLANRVVIHNPLNLHHRLFTAPPLASAADLRVGDDYEVFPALPIPPAPPSLPADRSALARMADDWLAFHRDIAPLLGVEKYGPLTEIVGKVRQLRLDRDTHRAACDEALEQRDDFHDQLDDALAVIRQQAQEITRLRRSASTEALSTLIADFQAGPKIDLLTIRMEVTSLSAQETLDREVAAKVADGWRVDHRQINTVPGLDLAHVAHFEFVKLVRPRLDPPAPEPSPTAAAAAPVDKTPLAAVELPDGGRLIVNAVPVVAVPLNNLATALKQPLVQLVREFGAEAVRQTLDDAAVARGRAAYDRLADRPQPVRPPVLALTAGVTP